VDDTTSETRVADALDQESIANDWILRGCATAEHQGRRCPTLGRIALVSRLGRGGMGVVYRGVHPRLATDVAVKILPPALEHEHAEFVDRFVREARLAARLRSDHLVAVLDVDRDDATKCHYLVMEYVDGTTAARWLEQTMSSGRRGTRESDALDLCIAATKGLAAAHAEDIVHRDVKPGNVLIPSGDDGRPNLQRAKLADLGLARGDGPDEALTATKIALGTPGYMAPEQARDARAVGKPADVFSMGATLYALLTGDAPFRATTPVEAIVRTVNGEFRPLRELRDDLAPATIVAVETCLRTDPADRFADAAVLLQALELCRGSLGADPAKVEGAAARVAALAARKDPVAPSTRTVSPRIALQQAAPSAAPARQTPSSPRILPAVAPRHSRAGTWAAVAMVAALAVGGVVFWTSSNSTANRTDGAVAPPQPAASAVAAPETSTAEEPSREESETAQPGASSASATETPKETPNPEESVPTKSLVESSKRTARPSAESAPKSEPAPSAQSAPDVAAASLPARVESSDPIVRAQEFDLGGIREDSWNVQQIRKLIAAHRSGDLLSAVTIQRKLATFYSRVGDTARAKVARERADSMERVLAATNPSASSGGAPPPGPSAPQPPQQPGGGTGAGQMPPPPSGPGTMRPPSGGGAPPPPPPPPRR
jgi:eukaryotic-like serine/threonine-protein kinase